MHELKQHKLLAFYRYPEPNGRDYFRDDLINPNNTANVSRFFSKEYTKNHDSKEKTVLGNANDINHGTYP